MKTAFILLLGFGGLTTFTCNSSKSKESAQIRKNQQQNPTLSTNSKVALFGPIIVRSSRIV